MNIDRHNYEMYFLLYVDNELSAEERNAVEQFAVHNNDLAAELESLKQTALPAEEIIFTSKQHLYKNLLIPDRLQEQLLLHLDNELEPSYVNSLCADIAGNEELTLEWNILKQTKLDQNEKIVFENKELLYRHEKNRVIPLFFWRVAAAVLVIGIAVFIGLGKFSGEKNQDIVGNNNGGQPSNEINQPGTTNSSSNEHKIEQQNTHNNLAANQTVKNDTSVNENKIQQEQQPGKNLVSISPAEEENVPDKKNIVKQKSTRDANANSFVQKETNHLPKTYFENINNQGSNKTTFTTVKDNIKSLKIKNEEQKPEDKNSAVAIVKEPKVALEDVALTKTSSGYTNTALLNQTDSEEGNSSIFVFNEDKVNRSKLSGFFKKVKRTITRNANINSGNRVKIAGFEIATR